MNTPTQRESNYVNRFFGGPPLSVIFRLILLSILIGVILEVLGLDPWNIIDSLRRLVLRIWEMGFDAVLMNTAIAAAKDPLLMAEAMQHAVLAGRQAFLAGRMQKKLYATASSPLEGVVR